MTPVTLFAAFAVVFLSGFGVARWLLRDAGRVYWPEIAGLAWLVGSGLVSVLLALCGSVARGPALIAVVTIAAMGIGFWLWRQAGSAEAPRCFPRDANEWEKMVSLLLLLPLVALALRSFREPLQWDGMFVWEIKARLAFLHGGAVPLSYYSDASMHVWSHPGYPLYLPMVELWVYLWLGELHQFWIKALFPFFYLAAACVLWSAALRLTGRVWIGAIAAWLLLCVPRVVDARAGVLQGYADLPLAILYVGALAALLCSASGDRAWLRVAGVLSGLLPWVKQEGLVLWACFALAAAWTWRRDWRVAAATALPGLLVIVLWRAFLAAADLTQPETFLPMTLDTLQANLPRVPALLRRMGEELILIPRWTLLWPLAVVALSMMALQRRRGVVPLAIAVFLPLAAYLVPYVFTALQPYQMHVETSIDRLVLQVAPLAVLVLALVLGEAGSGLSPRASAPLPSQPPHPAPDAPRSA